MKKLLIILCFCFLASNLISQVSRTTITAGMSGVATRNALNSNFTGLTNGLNLLRPKSNLLQVFNTGVPVTVIGDHFMGIRKGGDSIFIEVDEAAALNARNRIILPDGVTLGVQSVVDGYMTVSGGTNTVASANDAAVFGNESMIGRIQIPYFQYELGHDGGGNFLSIHGGDTTDPSLGGKVWGLGDMSDYFITAVDSSTNNDYNSKVFWDYPYIFTDARTRDHHDAASGFIGPNRLFVTGVSYNATTNRTKVYYNDSIYTKGTGWISTNRFNGAGTGMFAAGIYANAGVGPAAISLGMRTRSLHQAALSTGTGTLAAGNSSSSFGAGTYALGAASSSFGVSTKTTGGASAAFGYYTETEGQGSFAVGANAKTDVVDLYHFAYASNKIAAPSSSITGDAQGVLLARGGTSTNADGNVTALIAALHPNSSYTGITIITAVQTSNTPGYEGESGSWKLEWSAEMGDAHIIDSINLTSNRIYYTSTNPLRVDQKIAFNSYLSTADATGNGDIPGGLGVWQTFYVKTVNNVGNKYVTVAASQGGAEINITSFNASHIVKMAHWQINGSTLTLIARSFVNDGDDIGNGTTTGIRPYLSVTPHYFGIDLYNYGLTGRSMRWAHSTNFVVVEQK